MTQILTDEEITLIIRECARGSAINRDGSTSHRIARAIEQTILNKANGQEPFGYYENGRWSIVTDGGPDKWRARKEYTGPLYTHPAPSVPEGYQLVPIEPTEVMMWALYGHCVGQLTHLDYGYYKAMLSAARGE